MVAASEPAQHAEQLVAVVIPAEEPRHSRSDGKCEAAVLVPEPPARLGVGPNLDEHATTTGEPHKPALSRAVPFRYSRPSRDLDAKSLVTRPSTAVLPVSYPAAHGAQPGTHLVGHHHYSTPSKCGGLTAVGGSGPPASVPQPRALLAR